MFRLGGGFFSILGLLSSLDVFHRFSSAYLVAVLWGKREGWREEWRQSWKDSRGALNKPQSDGNSRVDALANLAGSPAWPRSTLGQQLLLKRNRTRKGWQKERGGWRLQRGKMQDVVGVKMRKTDWSREDRRSKRGNEQKELKLWQHVKSINKSGKKIFILRGDLKKSLPLDFFCEDRKILGPCWANVVWRL